MAYTGPSQEELARQTAYASLYEYDPRAAEAARPIIEQGGISFGSKATLLNSAPNIAHGVALLVLERCNLPLQAPFVLGGELSVGQAVAIEEVTDTAQVQAVSNDTVSIEPVFTPVATSESTTFMPSQTATHPVLPREGELLRFGNNDFAWQVNGDRIDVVVAA